MANPTSLGADANTVLGGNFAASAVQSSVILHPDREYSFRHNGVDILGADSTETIFLGLDDATITPDDSAEDNKVPLADGVAVTIGPGVRLLYFETASGSPCFSAVVGPRLMMGFEP